MVRGVARPLAGPPRPVINHASAPSSSVRFADAPVGTKGRNFCCQATAAAASRKQKPWPAACAPLLSSRRCGSRSHNSSTRQRPRRRRTCHGHRTTGKRGTGDGLAIRGTQRRRQLAERATPAIPCSSGYGPDCCLEATRAAVACTQGSGVADASATPEARERRCAGRAMRATRPRHRR